MNSFQHLPEYASAAQSYRRERTHIERAPRRTEPRTFRLGHAIAALLTRTPRTARPTSAVPAHR